MNVILLGAMAEAFGMDEFDWDSALERHVPDRFLEINRQAFETGRKLARQSS